MNHIIINSPSVFATKLPASGWVNLAQIRQLQYEVIDLKPTVVVVWSNGDKQIFRGLDAATLYDAWIDATRALTERRSNYRQINRRN